jgi:acyl-CoA synthetase (AMP-forming)/AMP-acid ligase II
MQNHFNITDLFFEKAALHPDKIAIIDRNQPISFGDFAQEIEDTVAYFKHKGIQKGDRVMLFVPMSIDLYRIVLALFKMGATAIFLDEWVSMKRLELCCEIAECKAFIGIFKARVLALFSKELRKIPIKLGKKYKRVTNQSSSITSTTVTDTALITFTTGSTGTPKAAKRTHGFLNEQFKALIEKIDPQPNDIDMPVLPIVLLLNLGAGSTSVITDFKASKPNKMKPEAIIKQINRHQVNRMVASPFFVKRLAQHLIATKEEVKSIQKVFTGGAPVFPTEAELYHEAFPNSRVEVVYGSTEAEPISSILIEKLLESKDDLLSKGLHVGVPYMKTKVKVIQILDEPITCDNELELDKLQVESGQIGEIAVSGSHVLREYFNNEKALKRNKIFFGNDCWHRTGDSGYLGKNGELYLTGRCNTLLTQNGKTVAPFIYENYLQSIEGIEIGTILEHKGGILAVIELEDNQQKKAIEAQIDAMNIDLVGVSFLRKIPRDPRHNSKIDYAQLKTLL